VPPVKEVKIYNVLMYIYSLFRLERLNIQCAYIVGLVGHLEFSDTKHSLVRQVKPGGVEYEHRVQSFPP
jgi:hypothetical protein